jgi:N4-gp56 family major capsid protein
MVYEDVSVKLEQYGDVHSLTDRVDDLAEDPVLSDMSMLSGEQAAETLEMVTYGVIKGGTNVAYANGSARTAVNTVVTRGLIRGAVRSLERNRAKRLTKMLAPSVNIGTKPIEGGFVAFCHTDLAHDIRNIDGFTPVVAYGSRQPLCDREFGSIEDVRFMTSPLFVPWIDIGGAKGSMLSTTGTYADVYPIIITGEEAWGTCPLKGANAISPIVLNPNTPTKSDPLGQIGFVGWKTYFAAVILAEAWMIRLEVAATAL